MVPFRKILPYLEIEEEVLIKILIEPIYKVLEEGKNKENGFVEVMFICKEFEGVFKLKKSKIGIMMDLGCKYEDLDIWDLINSMLKYYNIPKIKEVEKDRGFIIVGVFSNYSLN